MSKKNEIEWNTFSCENFASGGMSKKDTLAILKENGIRCRAGGYTCYVGHYAILVAKEDSDRAEKILWG